MLSRYHVTIIIPERDSISRTSPHFKNKITEGPQKTLHYALNSPKTSGGNAEQTRADLYFDSGVLLVDERCPLCKRAKRSEMRHTHSKYATTTHVNRTRLGANLKLLQHGSIWSETWGSRPKRCSDSIYAIASIQVNAAEFRPYSGRFSSNTRGDWVRYVGIEAEEVCELDPTELHCHLVQISEIKRRRQMHITFSVHFVPEIWVLFFDFELLQHCSSRTRDVRSRPRIE
eukprot:3380966-Rhodomonas_salina.2